MRVEKSSMATELRGLFNQAIIEMLQMREAEKEKTAQAVYVRAQIGMSAIEWHSLGQDVLQVKSVSCSCCFSSSRADYGFCNVCGTLFKAAK
jgi:hypothetical protein